MPRLPTDSAKAWQEQRHAIRVVSKMVRVTILGRMFDQYRDGRPANVKPSVRKIRNASLGRWIKLI